MKINRLETHDRLLEFKKQASDIDKGCADCIRNRPEEFGDHPFYIFAHTRTIGEDERISILSQDIQDSLINPARPRQYMSLQYVPTHRLIWQPRLSKPQAQENSMLFKCYPPDMVRPIWIIPARELWKQYKKQHMTAHDFVLESINAFNHSKGLLEAREDDDVPESIANAIYKAIAERLQKRIKQANAQEKRES